MMAFSRIEGQPNLIRDINTNSIINTNTEEYSRYLQTTKIKQEEKSKVEAIEKDLNNIKYEINEVKILLHKLLKSQPTD